MSSLWENKNIKIAALVYRLERFRAGFRSHPEPEGSPDDTWLDAQIREVDKLLAVFPGTVQYDRAVCEAEARGD